ncbi:membrane protein [Dietzia sp. NCCP-2495]|uniref:hypothetical protein n=1 Tax=Dietzia sp. NCCP-2495 TaxID=2934675 RepID=UPI002231385D|nr:hypothetical protein [Dietzia sp. NCCP-2495]GLB64546.1 membrane protein [Dietzia sp. NCCP-2495]
MIGATPLGMSDEIGFRDRTDEVAFPIPVPRGLTPKTLTGTVQTPVDLESGHLEAWSGDLLLARIAIDGRRDFTPVEIPLEGARVRNGVADVTLRTVLHSEGEACPDWTGRTLEFRDGEVVFDGGLEVPRVLADFIPPVLERLEIYLPTDPSTVEAEAAAELALAASARFGTRDLEVAILPADGVRATAASPFTRRVELREETESRITLVEAPVPTAEVVGDASTLAHQVRSVSTNLRDLAIADSVSVETNLPVPRALVTEATLNELDIGTVTSRGVGTVTATFGLDQTRLATAAGDVTLELSGTYSPPPADHSGLVVVEAGGTVIDSWVADPSGLIDRTVVVPGDVLGRYTDISVSLQTSGAGASCGVVQPLTMVLSGDSRLRIGESGSPAPRGFDSLPQAMMPRVQVATGSASLDDTRRAITILVELQRLSASLLRPEWVTVEELTDGAAPGLLVSSDGIADGLPLPLELTGGRTLEVMGAGDVEPAILRFSEDIDFASLQVVEDDDRAILVASTSSGSGELDRTLEWLSADPDRWAGLRGDVLFTAPGREPVQLSTAEAAGAAAVDEDGGSATVRTALLVGSVVAVAGVALAGLAWLATGRGRPRRRS